MDGTASSLRSRLRGLYRHRFVGRRTEIELFQQQLADVEPRWPVLYIFGPGGIGKTMLLRQYAMIAEDAGRPVLWVDGTETDASPQGFSLALERAAAPYQTEDNLPLDEYLERHSPVVLVDAYEHIVSLGSWLRDQFLPRLPSRSVTVLAGRALPEPAWLHDPGWMEIARIIALPNLSRDESNQVLADAGIPASLHQFAYDTTYGHPLALMLLAEWLRRSPAPPTDRRLEFMPSLMQNLVELFVRDAPSAMHREALEACAHVRVASEALLGSLSGPEQAPRLFEWLRSLSFVEQRAGGAVLHDLVRDVLDGDLRWRNPERYWNLHDRIRRHFLQRFEAETGLSRLRPMMDLMFMWCRLSRLETFYDWTFTDDILVDRARPDEHDVLLGMVRRHEGPESEQIAQFWLAQRPQDAYVFRIADTQPPIGFVIHLLLDELTDEQMRRDAVLAFVGEIVQSRGPLRPGELLSCTRFWMGRDSYQEPTIHTLVAASATVDLLSIPHLRWTFVCMSQPDDWLPLFSSIRFALVGRDVVHAGGRSIGVFAHDWGTEPVSVWRDRLNAHLRGVVSEASPRNPEVPQVVVLSQEEFARAVREALRTYTRPELLADNPLLRSRAIVERAGGLPQPSDVRAALDEAIEAPSSNPKDERLYRALVHTFVKPALSQERVAELLGIPFNTYRYHLAKGIERVAEYLWRQELYGVVSLPLPRSSQEHRSSHR